MTPEVRDIITTFAAEGRTPQETAQALSLYREDVYDSIKEEAGPNVRDAWAATEGLNADIQEGLDTLRDSSIRSFVDEKIPDPNVQNEFWTQIKNEQPIDGRFGVTEQDLIGITNEPTFRVQADSSAPINVDAGQRRLFSYQIRPRQNETFEALVSSPEQGDMLLSFTEPKPEQIDEMAAKLEETRKQNAREVLGVDIRAGADYTDLGDEDVEAFALQEGPNNLSAEDTAARRDAQQKLRITMAKLAALRGPQGKDFARNELLVERMKQDDMIDYVGGRGVGDYAQDLAVGLSMFGLGTAQTAAMATGNQEEAEGLARLNQDIQETTGSFGVEFSGGTLQRSVRGAGISVGMMAPALTLGPAGRAAGMAAGTAETLAIGSLAPATYSLAYNETIEEAKALEQQGRIEEAQVLRNRAGIKAVADTVFELGVEKINPFFSQVGAAGWAKRLPAQVFQEAIVEEPLTMLLQQEASNRLVDRPSSYEQLPEVVLSAAIATTGTQAITGVVSSMLPKTPEPMPSEVNPADVARNVAAAAAGQPVQVNPQAIRPQDAPAIAVASQTNPETLAAAVAMTTNTTPQNEDGPEWISERGLERAAQARLTELERKGQDEDTTLRDAEGNVVEQGVIRKGFLTENEQAELNRLREMLSSEGRNLAGIASMYGRKIKSKREVQKDQQTAPVAPQTPAPAVTPAVTPPEIVAGVEEFTDAEALAIDAELGIEPISPLGAGAATTPQGAIESPTAPANGQISQPERVPSIQKDSEGEPLNRQEIADVLGFLPEGTQITDKLLRTWTKEKGGVWYWSGVGPQIQGGRYNDLISSYEYTSSEAADILGGLKIVYPSSQTQQSPVTPTAQTTTQTQQQPNENDQTIQQGQGQVAQEADAQANAQAQEGVLTPAPSPVVPTQAAAPQPTPTPTQTNVQNQVQEASRPTLVESVPSVVQPEGQAQAGTPQREGQGQEVADLMAVRDNTATPEQVQRLQGQGLVEQVAGQTVITQAGIQAMPETERPRLTEQERRAEIQQQTQQPAGETQQPVVDPIGYGNALIALFPSLQKAGVQAITIEEAMERLEAEWQKKQASGKATRLDQIVYMVNKKNTQSALEGANIGGIWTRTDKTVAVSSKATPSAMAHEIGHAIMELEYANAPEATKKAIEAEYSKWFAAKYGKDGVPSVADQRRIWEWMTEADWMNPDAPFPQEQRVAKWEAYRSKFSEWFADEVAKWAATRDAPKSLVDKFFSELAQKLKKLWDSVRGSFSPNETLASWLDSISVASPAKAQQPAGDTGDAGVTIPGSASTELEREAIISSPQYTQQWLQDETAKAQEEGVQGGDTVITRDESGETVVGVVEATDSQEEAALEAELLEESQSVEQLPDEASVEEVQQAAPVSVANAAAAAVSAKNKTEWLQWMRSNLAHLMRFAEKIWRQATATIAAAAALLSPSGTRVTVSNEISPQAYAVSEQVAKPATFGRIAPWVAAQKPSIPVSQNNLDGYATIDLPEVSSQGGEVILNLSGVDESNVEFRKSPLEQAKSAAKKLKGDNTMVILPKRSAKYFLNQGSSAHVDALAEMLYEQESTSPKISAMLKSMGISESPDTFPWCATSASFALTRAGIKTSNASSRQFLSFGTRTEQPQYGDVVVMWNDNPDTGGKAGWGGHVGFYLGEVDGAIAVLSGNAKDEVNVSLYSKDRVLEYRSVGQPKFSRTRLRLSDGRTVEVPTAGLVRQSPQSLSRKPGLAQALMESDGAALQLGVSARDVEKGIAATKRQIPGASNIWSGTRQEFLDTFGNDPSVQDVVAQLEEGVMTEGFYVPSLQRGFILTDGVVIYQGDADRAALNGTTPAVEAVKRLIRHEVGGHGGWLNLTERQTQDFLKIARDVIPVSDMNQMIEDGYPFEGWQTNDETFRQAAEEWFSQRLGRMDKLPETGPLARFVEWLKGVWRWLTGRKGEPDIQAIKNLWRQIRMNEAAIAMGRAWYSLPREGARAQAVTAGDEEYLAAVKAGDIPAETPVYGPESRIELSRKFGIPSALNGPRSRVMVFWDESNDKIGAVIVLPERTAPSTPVTEQEMNDRRYIALVESYEKGNPVLQELQRMVNEAARRAGFNIGPVFHGTFAKEKFQKFDLNMLGSGADQQENYTEGYSGRGFYFDPIKSNADQWAEFGAFEPEGRKARTISVFLKMENPVIREFDSDGPKPTNKDGDGVIAVDAQGNPLEYVAFNPNQIKSADPVTYDSNGAPIPLSQRFQSTSNDIRYSRVRSNAELLARTKEVSFIPMDPETASEQIDVRDSLYAAFRGDPDIDKITAEAIKYHPMKSRHVAEAALSMWLELTAEARDPSVRAEMTPAEAVANANTPEEVALAEADHREAVAQAITLSQPVSAEAVARYGIPVPPEYALMGALYARFLPNIERAMEIILNPIEAERGGFAHNTPQGFAVLVQANIAINQYAQRATPYERNKLKNYQIKIDKVIRSLATEGGRFLVMVGIFKRTLETSGSNVVAALQDMLDKKQQAKIDSVMNVDELVSEIEQLSRESDPQVASELNDEIAALWDRMMRTDDIREAEAIADVLKSLMPRRQNAKRQIASLFPQAGIRARMTQRGTQLVRDFFKMLAGPRDQSGPLAEFDDSIQSALSEMLRKVVKDAGLLSQNESNQPDAVDRIVRSLSSDPLRFDKIEAADALMQQELDNIEDVERREILRQAWEEATAGMMTNIANPSWTRRAVNDALNGTKVTGKQWQEAFDTGAPRAQAVAAIKQKAIDDTIRAIESRLTDPGDTTVQRNLAMVRQEIGEAFDQIAEVKYASWLRNRARIAEQKRLSAMRKSILAALRKQKMSQDTIERLEKAMAATKSGFLQWSQGTATPTKRDPKATNPLRDLIDAHSRLDVPDFIEQAVAAGLATDDATKLRDAITRYRNSRYLDPDSPLLSTLFNQIKNRVAGDIDWADLISVDQMDGKKRQAEIYKRITNHAALRGMDRAQKIALTKALNRLWVKKKQEVMKRELRKLGLTKSGRDPRVASLFENTANRSIDLTEFRERARAVVPASGWRKFNKEITNTFREIRSGAMTPEKFDELIGQPRKMMDVDVRNIIDSTPEILRYMNLGMWNAQALRDAISEKYGVKSLDSKEAKEIEDLARQAYNAEPGLPRNKLLVEIMRKMANLEDVSMLQLFQSARISNLLFSLRTFMAAGLTILNSARRLLGLIAYQSISSAMGRTPQRMKASLESSKKFFASMPEAAVISLAYLSSGDVSLLPTITNDLENMFASGKFGFSTAQMVQSEKLVKELRNLPARIKRDVKNGDARKVIRDVFSSFWGLTVMSVQRIMGAIDLFVGTTSRESAIPLVAALNPDLFDLKKVLAEQRPEAFKKAYAQAELELFGRPAKGVKERAEANIRAREFMARIFDPYLVQDAQDFAQETTYQMNPTGVGGFLYSAVNAGFRMVEAGADKLQTELASRIDRREVAGLEKQASQLAVGALRFIASGIQTELGLRFIRFTGNRINELISLTPVLGLARMLESDIQQSRLKKATLAADQAFAIAFMMWAASVIMEEWDDDKEDEERGWYIEGPWSGLTADEKNAAYASGKKPYTFAVRVMGKWQVFNYREWQTAGLFATLGAMMDRKRYQREAWDKQGATGAIVSSMALGLMSFKDMSSMSQLMTLSGNNPYERDPVQGSQDAFGKFAGSFLSSMVPTFTRDIDYMMNPEHRKAEFWHEQAVMRIPFARLSAGQPMLDIFFEPVVVDRGPLSRVVYERTQEPARIALGRLNSADINANGPELENRIVGRGMDARPMTESEKTRFKQRWNRDFKRYLVTNTDRLLRMKRDEAQEKIRDDLNEIKQNIEDEVAP